MMNLQDKINALPLSDRNSIARSLVMINNMPGLTESERQREKELHLKWVSFMFQYPDVLTNHLAMLKERLK